MRSRRWRRDSSALGAAAAVDASTAAALQRAGAASGPFTTLKHAVHRNRYRTCRLCARLVPMTQVELAGAVREDAPVPKQDVVFDIRELTVAYGSNVAVKDVNLEIYRNLITAVIGPSGC